MDPILGELRIMATTFAPQGWLLCDGKLVQVSQYTALFTLLGTTYGGDGTVTFGLPDLCARLPIGHDPRDPKSPIGTPKGTGEVALKVEHLPPHTHVLSGTTRTAASAQPNSAMLMAATDPQIRPYNDLQVPGTGDALFSPLAITGDGGNQPHDNIMPTMPLIYMICWQGVYPNFS